MLRDRVTHPRFGALVLGHQLLESERLTDPAAQLCGDDLQLHAQAISGDGITRRHLKAAVAVFPLSSGDIDHYRHGRRTYPLRSAANRRPGEVDLRKDLIAQLVARLGQREGHVGVEALETSRSQTRTGDAEVELRAQLALPCVRALEARSQPGILGGGACPALNASGRFEPRHRRDELWARQPEGRRERLAAVVERVLFRDRWMSERTADDNAPEGPRRPA
jgi:hypothetical protein